MTAVRSCLLGSFKKTSLTVAALVLAAGQASAAVPAAMDRVPKDAMIVIATDNFEQTSKRIKTYAEKLRVGDTDDFDDFVEQLSGTKGFKKDGSLALVVMPPPEAKPDAKKDVEADGDAGMDDPMQRAVLLVPVTDYKTLVTELGGDASKEIAQVDGLGDAPLFCRDAGSGWAIIGPAEEGVKNFKPGDHMLKQHEEALGVVGNRAAQSSDVLLVTNWSAIAPRFEKQIDQLFNNAKKTAKRGNPMFGPIPPETIAKFMAPVEGVFRAYNRDTQTCVIGVGLGDKGLTIDVGAQFKPKSEIAGFFQSTGKAATSVTSLPNTPFLVAASFDSSNAGTRQMVRNAADIAENMLTTAKEEAKRQQAEGDKPASQQVDMAIKMFENQTAGVRNLAKSIDKIDGVDFIWGYSPAMLAGAGLFSGVIYQARGSDPQMLKSLFVDQIKSVQNMEGPMKMEVGLTPNAAEVAGVKLDSWTLKPKMDPNDPGASQMAMVNMFIFGATGQMSGFIGTSKNAAIVTYSPNTQVMQQALDAAAGKGTIGSDKGVEAAFAPLPEGSWARGLVGTKSLFDLGQMAMSFTGVPLQMKVPADVPPMAFGMTGDGGGMHIRFHAPMQVISTIGDVMDQFREAQGGDDEGGDEEKKDQKPRF